jgi:subtilisin family serine protease
MKKAGVFCVLMLMILIPLSVVSAEQGAVSASVVSEEPSFDGYLVQFEEEPVLERKAALEKQVAKLEIDLETSSALYKYTIGQIDKIRISRGKSQLSARVERQKEKVEVEQRRGYADLKERVPSLKERGKSKLKNRYKNVFNGLALDVTSEEARKMKESPYVKEVYPNYMVNITLMDSVSLINADDVWQLDEDGDSCAATGKDCLTGEGITIAVIDTGVDYSHFDLGNCSFPKPAPSSTCFEPIIVNKSGCVELDGGINYCHQGRITLSSGGGWYDYCMGDSLIERYCEEDGTVSEVQVTCAEDEQCTVGACVKKIDINNLSCDKVIGGYDFVNNDNNPMDDHGHGTHCAATAAGRGVLEGVAPDAKIYAYKVLSSRGAGYTSNIIAAIEMSVDPNQDGNFSDRIDVISMSLGGTGDPGDPTSTAVNNAVDNGVVAVIAGGNSGPIEGTIGSPGVAKNAITVGANDKNKIMAPFSSKGPLITGAVKPDISAPGVDICAAQWEDAWSENECIDTEHTAISGTSMATPHVAGAVALIKQAHPDWTPDEIKMALRNSAEDLGYELTKQGQGTINISNAIFRSKPPIAILDLPEMSAERSLRVYGTARSDNLLEYRVYYGAGDKVNDDYVLIYSSSNNAIQDVLTLWDTTNVKDGIYTLKLEVEDTNGQISRDYFFVYVLNNGWFKKIRDIPAAELFAPHISDLDGDGNKEIIVSLLRDLRYPRLTKLFVLDSNGETFSGWPKEIEAHSVISAIGDLDNDGDMEVVASTNYNKLYAWHHNGDELTGFPIEIGMIASAPSMGDVDKDGSLDIVVITVDRSFVGEEPQFTSKLHVIDKNGNELTGFPIEITSIEYTSLLFTPTLADVDRDGFLEMLYATYSLGGSSKIYIWNHDGTNLESWPKEFSNKGFYSSPLIADIDLDESLDIVAFNVDGDGIVAYNSNGTLKQGWPISGGLSGNLALANIDNDEYLEVVLGGVAYNHDGTIVNGWPILPYKSRFQSIIADIDNDNVVELLHSGTDKLLYVHKGDGSMVSSDKFPKPLVSSSDSPLAAGDLNNDGRLEIVSVDSMGFMYVWSLDTPYSPSKLEWMQFYHDPQHTGLYKELVAPPVPPPVEPPVTPNQTNIKENTGTGRSCDSICGDYGENCVSVGTDAGGTNGLMHSISCPSGPPCSVSSSSADCSTLAVSTPSGGKSTNCRCEVPVTPPVTPECVSDADCAGEVCQNGTCVTAPVCVDTTWTPGHSTVCAEEIFIQTSNCGSVRKKEGNKTCSQGYKCNRVNNTCERICVDSSWLPSPSTICFGNLFAQKSNCENWRLETGNMTCPQGYTCDVVNNVCVEESGVYTFTITVKEYPGQNPINGADVYIDGVHKGKTDANGKLIIKYDSIEDLKVTTLYGQITIKVTKTGFERALFQTCPESEDSHLCGYGPVDNAGVQLRPVA